MFSLIVLLLAAQLFPMPPQHIMVTTSASADSVKPGGTITLFVDVTPKPKIHVYAPGAKDYTPIALALKAPRGVTIGKLAYPKSEILFFEPLNERVPVYQKPFRLAQEVAVGEAVETTAPIRVTGTVEYQACDDTTCFKPASIPISWTVSVR